MKGVNNRSAHLIYALCVTTNIRIIAVIQKGSKLNPKEWNAYWLR